MGSDDSLPVHLKGSVLVVAGPTGVGKTDLTMSLAERFPLEIVNADSRQVYRRMDIGTAKPSAAQLASVPHHLFDIREPDDTLTLAEYQLRAETAIDGVLARGRIAVLAGGTPLYVRSLVENLRIPQVPPDPELRSELEADLERRGVDALFARLKSLDPDTAEVTDPQNGRRIVRALEIYLKTGSPKRHLEGSSVPKWPLRLVALTMPRGRLLQAVDRRFDRMMEVGLLDETRKLLAAEFDPKLPSMQALGYRSLVRHLRGELDLPSAVQEAKHLTHRFVRHQYTGFRRFREMRWFDVSLTELSVLARQIAAGWPVGFDLRSLEERDGS